VKTAVEGIGQPELFFIRRQADAVARTAVALGWSFAKSFHLDTVQHLASFQIADFKAEQFIDVHIAKGLAAVDREGPDHIAERANFERHFMSFRICDAQDG